MEINILRNHVNETVIRTSVDNAADEILSVNTSSAALAYA